MTLQHPRGYFVMSADIWFSQPREEIVLHLMCKALILMFYNTYGIHIKRPCSKERKLRPTNYKSQMIKTNQKKSKD